MLPTVQSALTGKGCVNWHSCLHVRRKAMYNPARGTQRASLFRGRFFLEGEKRCCQKSWKLDKEAWKRRSDCSSNLASPLSVQPNHSLHRILTARRVTTTSREDLRSAYNLFRSRLAEFENGEIPWVQTCASHTYFNKEVICLCTRTFISLIVPTNN